MNKIRQNTPPKGRGRPKGSPNKTTALLKDAILQAATDAGKGDLIAYLRVQAIKQPGAFLALLGKVLPMQIAGDPDMPVRHIIERRIIDPSPR